MINPNICKLVTVDVPVKITKNVTDCWVNNATYQGIQLKVFLRDKPSLKPGRRRLFLKYSILNNEYYLSDRG